MNLKQYFIKISLMFIMTFMVTSCGSESSTLASSNNDKLGIETKQSIFDQERNLLNIDFLVKNNYDKKVDVSLENLSVEVNPCNIKEVSMTPKNIHFSENFQQQYVTALIEFNEECTPASYIIRSSKILTLEDESNKLTYESEKMDISPNSHNSTKPNTYSFFNTPLPLTIKEAEASYHFKVQLIDEESRGVSGEEVRILTYDVRYGEIENLSVTTDANGFANFTFTSIKNLARVHNKTLTLTIVQGEGLSTISTDINLKFEAPKVTPKNYQFQNPSSIVVKNAGESKNISIDIVNSLGIGESGKTVYITTIPSEFGAISSSSTVTNDAGRAIFEYTAPESLDRINNKSTTLKVSFKDGDTELSETVKITIRKSLELDENVQAEVEEVEVLEVYSFQNATSITVVKKNQSKDISIDLVDSMGMGVAGETIKISNIPSSFGEFISATATTNEAGRATFHYKAPNNIDDIDGNSTTVTLAYTNEQKRHITQDITIDIEKSQGKVSGNYLFQNATSITVRNANESKNISIDLVNNLGIGIPEKTIQITNIPKYFGLIDSSTATTNESGRATFNYTAPENIDEINGNSTSITLSFINENGTTTTQDITISINKSIDTEKYKFQNATSITIKEANESKNISIDLVNNLGIGVSEKTIQITNILSQFGLINSSTAITNEAGRATFNYTAPENIDEINGSSTSITLSFINENGITTTQDITISINKSIDTKKYKFQNATSITVIKGNENKNISIDLVNNLGIGVSGKTIQITNIPNQFGLIDSSTAITNEAGRATFNYTAPENIDEINGKSTSTTLSFINENGTTTTQDITISINKSIDTEKYKFQNASSITVAQVNEEKNISIDLVDSMGVGVAGQTVKISNIPSHLGTFIASTATTNEAGRATFHYIGPEDISDIDVESIKVNLIFIHEDNRKLIQPIDINFAISDNPHIPIDYKLSLNTDNDDFSMGIPELQKRFTIILKDKKGDVVKNNDVNFTKIHVQTENSLIAQIYDTTNKKLVNESTLRNENSASFIIKSKKLSGIVPLKATVEFIDINKETKKLSTIVNVRVMSGPPSAISISYVSTGQDEARAKYEEKFAISATDEYGNKVNSQPYISLGAIVGYAVDGGGKEKNGGIENSDTRRLFYGKNDNPNGKLIKGDTPSDAKFSVSSPKNIFQYVNAEGTNTDKLVVFGAGKNYEAMGKWDIEAGDSFNQLIIQDDYFGKTRENLYYAVGHNYYQDQCQDDGREWIGSTDSETYQLDEEGTVIVSYKYDYHLTGKDALIWVNLNGYQPYVPIDKNDTGEGKDTRIGEVIKHTLRGRGLISIPEEGYSIKKGTTKPITFKIHHENAPEWYRNANFVNQIEATKCNVDPKLTISSNDFDARTCYNGGTGVAYITYIVSAPDENTSCNFNINKVLVTDEFKRINGKR